MNINKNESGKNRIKKLLEKELIYPATHKAYTIWLQNWFMLNNECKEKTIKAIILDFDIAFAIKDI